MSKGVQEWRDPGNWGKTGDKDVWPQFEAEGDGVVLKNGSFPWFLPAIFNFPIDNYLLESYTDIETTFGGMYILIKSLSGNEIVC